MTPRAKLVRVSVVIPTFDGDRFIAQTIDSLLSQTFYDFEVVVSDDGSTDRTLEIVESFDDPRVRVLATRTHLGAAGNWNRALAAATGEYVKVLAHDDLPSPDNLEVQVAALDGNPEASFVAVRRDIIGADGSTLMHGRGLSGLCGLVGVEEASRKVVRSGANQFGEGAAVLFRRAASDSIGLFDASLPYVIDIDYWLRLLSWGSAIALSGTHASFRVSAQSWSSALVREQGRQFAALIDRVAGDPQRGITRSDVVIGKVRASANGYLRQMFYLRYRRSL